MTQFRNWLKKLGWNSPASLEDADLTGRAFRKADLSRAKLLRAELAEADLRDADLRGADLSDAGILHANFTGALLDRANLRVARGLETAIWRNASLRGVDLTGLSFHGPEGQHLQSPKNHWLGRRYGGADLSFAILDDADCRNACFSRCVLGGASFRNADCRGVSFAHADLRQADFTGANLRGADFAFAILTGTILPATDAETPEDADSKKSPQEEPELFRMAA